MSINYLQTDKKQRNIIIQVCIEVNPYATYNNLSNILIANASLIY